MNIFDEIKNIHAPTSQLRKFGFLVGSIVVILSFWLDTGWWLVVFGGGLVVGAFIAPRSLAPFYRAWMTFGIFMGAIVSRVVLFLVFFIVLTPLAYIARFLGRDILHLLPYSTKTYWVTRIDAAPTKDSYDQQY